MDETEIRSFFARYGSVKEVKIITDRTGVSKGYVNILDRYSQRDAWMSDMAMLANKIVAFDNLWANFFKNQFASTCISIFSIHK